MSTFAFVFARGGSKGVPRKNLMPLGGLPLLAHSIRTAQQLPSVTGVWVSTDDEEIASVAREFGAGLIQRPPELASDSASEWLAWRHAVTHLQQAGRPFQTFLSLPATSPLRGTQDAQSCLDALDENTDVVVTVTPASRSPYFNMVTRDEQGRTKVVLHDPNIRRRQDAPVVYDMTTVAYVTRPDFILNQSGVFSGRVRSVVVPRERAVDIDDPIDLLLAQALFDKRTP
jgi:CMP-N-acetylneuraminic acid synthetase